MTFDVVHDQHFMIDKKLLSQIASYCSEPIVTEIGPGKGALTKELLTRAKVSAIEIDTSLEKELYDRFHDDILKGNLTIQFKDVLDATLQGVVFSNLPYGISESFFYQLLHNDVTKAFLVAGDLFYRRLTGTDKLGIICSHCFTVKKLQDVSKESFSPKPKVNSVFFSLEKKTPSFISEIFMQNDKKIKNALIESITRYGKTKNEAKKLISLDSAIADKGMTTISNEEFKIVYKEISRLEKAL